MTTETLVGFYWNVCHRFKSAKVTDKRIKVMNEIISGMRLIKMYAWEWAFHEYVKNIRKLVCKPAMCVFVCSMFIIPTKNILGMKK